MSDENEVAPSEATLEVMQPETEQDENAAGQVETQPAEVEAEEKTKAQERRERRKAQEQRQREDYDTANRKLQEAETRQARVKAAAASREAPKEADFPDIIEFAAAKGAWSYANQNAQAQVAEAATETEQAKTFLETQRAAQQMARREAFNAETADARIRYPDFDAVLQVASNATVMSNAISDMVLESEQAVDLAYHLGKNPQIAAQLSQMPPLMAARELGKIEARLIASPPNIVSKAPPPINPVRPSGSASKDVSKMPGPEYIALRATGWHP